MPQATDEQREAIIARFGSIDIEGPLKFLSDKGYTEKAGYLILPNPLHKVTKDEGECIDFLCDEWDFAFTVDAV